MGPVDLEDLAVGYRQRPTTQAAAARAARAGDAARLGPGDLALDLGGGRGRHATVWAQRGARAVVVDAARGMVRVAATQPGVDAICASTQALPLRDDSTRLAYFHLSLHYGDWRMSLNEVIRVLASGGECWIWTMGEAHHRASFLARWFPSVGDIDAERFPEPGIVAEFLAARAESVTTGTEVEQRTMSAGRWRDAAAARFVSTLQLISPAELSRGLAEFDAAYPDPSHPIDYVLTFDWIQASV